MLNHSNLLSKMTLEEKAALLSGKTVFGTRDLKRHNIPSLLCSDGPHGVRKQADAADHLGLNEAVPATCFPTSATIANSWDETLGEAIGEALGEESCAQDVDILLGPGLNIKRSPLCGRNFEYFSEDPYLSGKMAAAYVRGIQSKGVYACPKHFAVNSQELRRMAMNSVLDERTLREIYLTGFEIAVKEGKPGAIMTSYNEVNGVYANENHHLLQEILRKEWGFDGIVITDWGGSNDHVQGVKENSNLEMPSPGLDSARILLKAVENGTLKEEELDQCVDTLLDAVFDLAEKREKRIKEYDRETHHALAKRAACESVVLLKNKDHILPLNTEQKVAVIGDFAFTPRYQGSGSSAVNSWRTDRLEEVIAESGLKVTGICKGYIRTGEEDEELLKQAVQIAGAADVVIFCFGLNELSESEGIDRAHMKIPENQIRLLYAIAQVNSNIVGVLSAGASIEMPWEEKCKAILHGYLYGQAGAGAICDLLTGKANPCGKLAETYPLVYTDTPAYEYFPSRMRNSEYRESIYVGYRYYEKVNRVVKYPFGFGLSYTTFAYDSLQITDDGVSFRLTNTGDRDGAEITQLYIGLPDSGIFRAQKELKGFKKVFLKAGESQTVQIPFDDKSFRYWNIRMDRWETEPGDYEIMVASDSQTVQLKGMKTVRGTEAPLPYSRNLLPSYYSGEVQKVSDQEYEKLLGYSVVEGETGKELTVNDAICQLEHAKSILARLIFRVLKMLKEKSEKKGKPDLNILFIYNMPFRGIAKMTNGMVSMEMADGMVMVVNGHFFKGLGKVIRGFFRNQKENKLYEEKLNEVVDE
jgi:beta-glucosidase